MTNKTLAGVITGRRVHFLLTLSIRISFYNLDPLAISMVMVVAPVMLPFKLESKEGVTLYSLKES